MKKIIGGSAADPFASRWFPCLRSDRQRMFVNLLCSVLAERDIETREHVTRVAVFATGLARAVGITNQLLTTLQLAALLHDVGKICIPDTVLRKPGKLTAAEFDLVKRHTVIGQDMLAHGGFDFEVGRLVRAHHERFDGAGYPDGLRGEVIPIAARVISIADCYDALREDRPYRQSLSRDAALQTLRLASGTFYDPELVRAFVAEVPRVEDELEVWLCAKSQRATKPTEQLTARARLVEPAAGLERRC